MFDRILVPLDGSEAAEAALAVVEMIPSRRVRLLAVESEFDRRSPRCARPNGTARRIWSGLPNHCAARGGRSRRSWRLAPPPSRSSRPRRTPTWW